MNKFEGLNTISNNQKPEKIEEIITNILGEAEKLEIKLNDRNKKGELLVLPNGNISNLGKQSELYWKIARTESFKKFFGDWQNKAKESSKVVDKNGEPLIVYRCMKRDISFEDFYKKDNYYTPPGKEPWECPFYDHDYGEGVYFTPQINYAKKFGGANFSGFLNVKNPKYSYQEVAFDKLAHLDQTYDAVYGETVIRKPLSYLSNKIVEDLSQIKVTDPNQFLMVPSKI